MEKESGNFVSYSAQAYACMCRKGPRAGRWQLRGCPRDDAPPLVEKFRLYSAEEPTPTATTISLLQISLLQGPRGDKSTVPEG